MLVFDELKKNDPQLRLVAMLLAGGLFILLAGLWWVQVVSARAYQSHLETQAYRTIRIPAVRGKILDRDGRVLAENRPRYNLSLYFDDLGGQFKAEYERLRPVKLVTNSAPFWKFWSRAKSVETQHVRLKQNQIDALMWQARYDVVDQIFNQVGQRLGQPLMLDPKNFERSYAQERAMPYTILPDLNDAQIARFEESCPEGLGANLELESVRDYPFGTTAAHILGYLRHDDSSVVGEDAFFNYRLPDYSGVTGVEGNFDAELHGRAGVESVLVNNLGYRQSEDIGSQPEPGQNVVLTVDLDIQRAAEESLAQHQGADAHGAIVVMDVNSGDVLALVSSPAFDPNDFAHGITSEKWQQMQTSTAERNRATFENYAPGSIFKPIVALAALENGLDPNALVDNPGYVMVGRRRIRDEAPPGQYNLQRAIAFSCNTYFVTVGLRTGIDKIISLAEKFHFGERTGLLAHQETPGILPTLKEVENPDWHDGDSANICIGQGKLAVTPIQMAVAYSAIANGGTVLWPQLVEKIVPQDPTSGKATTVFPSGVVRDHIGVSEHNLKIVREAMLSETEEGTGVSAQVAGLKICGKTGTAQVTDEHNREIGRTVWFASFAPYENPRYAVVVMLQGGVNLWGHDCAPIAHDIYEALMKKGNLNPQKNLALN